MSTHKIPLSRRRPTLREIGMVLEDYFDGTATINTRDWGFSVLVAGGEGNARERIQARLLEVFLTDEDIEIHDRTPDDFTMYLIRGLTELLKRHYGNKNFRS